VTGASKALDVVVVGGGPVGLATAIAARSRGLSVRVIDRQRPPIDKACGEGLLPAGVAALAALGVPVPERSMPFRGIRYVSGGVVAEADFPGGEAGRGRGVRRTELSRALAARAEESGVELSWGERVEEVKPGEVRTAAAVWRCRYVVGADGLHSRVRRTAGRERSRRYRIGDGTGADGADPVGTSHAASWNPRARFGISRHLRLPPWSERVEVTFGDAAEAYVTPLAPDEIGVAILWTGGKGGFDDLLATRFSGDLARRLAAGTALGRDHGAGPLLQPRSFAVAPGGLALVGDAAGYIDALTGEGMGLAFGAAELLADCVVRDCPDDYDRQWRRLTRRYRMLTAALVQASAHAPLRSAIVPAAQALPSVFSRLVNLLAH
jgi:2-polyprenyl-6-methoxyphenol hydroxylase-like FAD-dependent oxidoreductase